MKGEHTKFVHRHALTFYRKTALGENNPRWKGGRIKDADGYIRLLRRDHPYSNSAGYILEHRIVMEEQTGRFLMPWESVHHKNGIKDDNRPDNLELWYRPHPPGISHCPHCGEKLTPSRSSAGSTFDQSGS